MSGPGPLIQAFVAHGLTAEWEAMPAPAQRAVKTFVLDSLGVGIAGAGAPLTKGVRAAAQRWGGDGPAHIWGRGGCAVAPAQAAFVNGFQIHCQEFDCVHEPAVVHPLATILAALMAQAQALSRPVTGRSFGAALAVAVDLAAGLGVAATSGIRFFRPANAGIFGATLGVARLRGFDERQTLDALGTALGFCSGTMQAHVEGKPTLPLQIANAARGALMACDVVEEGVSGPHDALEGPFGYFSLFEETVDIAPVLDSIGQDSIDQIWRIAEVSHKPYPTGRAAQGGIALMEQLRQRGVMAHTVREIVLTAPPLIPRLVGRPVQNDMAASYARLCFAYLGAATLLHGPVGLEDFTPEALMRPEVLKLAARIRVVDDGGADPAAFAPQTLTVFTEDGATHEARLEALYGSPADPLTPQANEEKFRRCLAFGFGSPSTDIADAMIAAVDDLEHVEDVGRLAQWASGALQGEGV